MADDIRFVVSVDDRDLIRAQSQQKKFERNLVLIEAAFRNGQITSARYNRELARQASELRKLGGSYNKANSEVRKYAAQLRRMSDENFNMQAALSGSTRGLNRFGVIAQQSGYQIGDFLVQIQSGTNPLVAFGQQATQIAGTLTLLGGRMLWIGTALGIIIPIITAFGAVWMRTMSEAEEATNDLEDALKSLDRELRDFASRQEARARGMSWEQYLGTVELEEATEGLASAREEFERLQAIQMATAQAGGVDILSLLGLGDNSLEEAQTRLQEAEERLRSITELLRERDQQRERENLLKSAVEYFDQWVEGQQEALQRTNEQREAERQLAEERRRAQEEAIANARRFSDELSRSNRISAAISMNMRSMGGSGRIDPRFVPTQSPGRVDPSQLPNVVRDSSGNWVLDTPATRTGGGGGGGRSLEPLSDYLNSLREEATFRRSLVGVSQEQVTQMERERELRDMISQATGVELEIGDSRLQQLVQMEAQTRQLMEAEQQRQALQKSFEQTIERGLMSMVEGASSVEDAFKSMIRNILLEVVRQQFVNPIAKSIGGFFTGLFSANGNAFSGGRVLPFANGGVVSSPTMFPMQGGAGLMGEAGPEAIMPLKRTASGKLGVVSEGGGNITIQQNFNFQANGDESVKRIIAQSAPQIAQMTQQKIMDSRRRGGAMKAAFS